MRRIRETARIGKCKKGHPLRPPQWSGEGAERRLIWPRATGHGKLPRNVPTSRAEQGAGYGGSL
jgi:hypothetical protein